METKKSTFQKVLTTGKKTLAIGAVAALGFVTPYVIAAKTPTNAEISQRIAQQQIVREADENSQDLGARIRKVEQGLVAKTPSEEDIFYKIAQQQIVREADENSQDLGAQIMKVAQGLREGYQQTKSEAVRQSPFVGYVDDQKSLEALGAPKGTKAVVILSENATLDKGDSVFPIDKKGKFIPKSYFLSATLPENIKKLDYVLLKNGETEGTFVYSVNNKNGNVSSNFIPKTESEKTKSTLENKVSGSSCENIIVDWLGSKYSEPESSTLLNVSSPNVHIRTAYMGGTLDCTPTQENKYEKIDPTTLGWRSNTPFREAYPVTLSTN